MDLLIIIYLATIIMSIGVGLLLVHFARLTSQHTKSKPEKERYCRTSLSYDSYASEDLDKVLFEEISEVVDSKKHCEEVNKIVSGIFFKELDKRTELSRQQLDQRYKVIIDEKTKDQEIAWKKYKKTLEDKRETDAVIRSIAEGLVVVDAKGKVIMMNPAAEKLLNVSKKNKIGRPILEGIRKDQLISLSKASPDSKDREIEIVSREDETKRILRSSSAIIENENGQTVGMVSVLSDITKQKELDRMKSNFVSSVTHELRTPLVAIQKAISMLVDGTTGRVSETQEEFLSLADRNIKRLSVLINDLLDLSKLEAGRMEIRKELVSMEGLINEAVEGLRAWAETKSIKIEKRIEGKIPDVYADFNRLIQVLNNLIGNAIKFTPQNGNITIEMKTREGEGETEIAVQDTGIGITKEDLTRVFDKFYQTGERISADINGTGIGLSIAKEIVELHGGRIWAESERDRGARFIFTLPIK